MQIILIYIIINRVPRSRGFVLSALNPFFLIIGSIAATIGSSDAAIPAKSVDKLTEQWLSIEAQTRALQSNWDSERPLLEQHLKILRAEQEQLQQLLSKTQADTSDVDQQRLELFDQQNQLEQDSAKLTQGVTLLRERLAQHHVQFPSALIANTAANDALTQLEALYQLQEQITTQESVINVDGTPVMAQQLYLGLSYAWFVSQDQQLRGIGRVQQGQWQWYEQPKVDSSAVKTAIAIAEQQQLPEFVELWLELVPGAEPQ